MQSRRRPRPTPASVAGRDVPVSGPVAVVAVDVIVAMTGAGTVTWPGFLTKSRLRTRI